MMKWKILFLAAVFSTFACHAQDEPERTAARANEKTEEAPAKDRDDRFKEMMTNVILEGRWCLVEEDELTEEKEDSYRILSVMKAGGDTWIIQARIEYGDRVATVPVPVQVKWAGETPVITLDKNDQVPQLGQYSARVVLHEGTYAGTWSGGDRKGLLHGIIRKQ